LGEFWESFLIIFHYIESFRMGVHFMNVYVLDKKSESLKRMLECLSDNKKISEVEVFDDYDLFISKVIKSNPALCIIRLGCEEIPGLKAARMVKLVNCDIRVVFISESRDYALDAFEIGANGYMLGAADKTTLNKCLE
jgi:DNA-binding NarL/FixJ family response regulator